MSLDPGERALNRDMIPPVTTAPTAPPSAASNAPVMIGASLMLDGSWRGKGVFNVEQMDPDPFMKLLGEHGLSWTVEER